MEYLKNPELIRRNRGEKKELYERNKSVTNSVKRMKTHVARKRIRKTRPRIKRRTTRVSLFDFVTPETSPARFLTVYTLRRTRRTFSKNLSRQEIPAGNSLIVPVAGIAGMFILAPEKYYIRPYSLLRTAWTKFFTRSGPLYFYHGRCNTPLYIQLPRKIWLR